MVTKRVHSWALSGVLLASLGGTAHAQWAKLPAPGASDFTGSPAAGCEDLQFVDANTGFWVAIGNDPGNLVKMIPIFMKTTDGSSFSGARIAELGNVSNNATVRVHFFDANVGHVAAGGKVARTTNGGTGWSLVTLPMGGSADHVWTLGATSAVAAGTGGIYRTTDGSAWTKVSSTAGGPLLFFDANVGVVPGQRTTDGGATWTAITFPPLSVDRWTRVSSTVGYALGAPQGGDPRKLSKTTDAGQTWSTPATIAGCLPYTMAFLDEMHGVVGCLAGPPGGQTPFNLYTADGGATWSQEAWPASWPAMGLGSGINGVKCAAFPASDAAYAGWDYYEKQLIKRTGGGPGTGTADMATGGSTDGGTDTGTGADMTTGGGPGGDGGTGAKPASGGCSIAAGSAGAPLFGLPAAALLLALRRRRAAR